MSNINNSLHYIENVNDKIICYDEIQRNTELIH